MSRRLSKITETTRERTQSLHDAVYSGAFIAVVSPLMYAACGARDAKEIAIGTATAIGFGMANGAPIGYAVDMFRDLTGLKRCERPSYPDLLRRQSSRTKKGLAVLLTAGAIVLTTGIYSLTPNKQDNGCNAPVPQQVIESQER